MTKILSISETEGTTLTDKEHLQKKPIAHIILSGKKLNAFP